MNNAVYGKTTENIRNRIDVKLGSKEKDYLKGTSKQSYMSQKIFDTDLVANQPKVVFHTETSPLFCSTNQMTGSYMK